MRLLMFFLFILVLVVALPVPGQSFQVIESLPPLPRDTLETAIRELADLVRQYCGGAVSTAFLDRESRQTQLK